METKLRLVFLSPQSTLAYKALAFGCFFALAKMGGFSLFSLALFAAVSIFLYTRPLFRTFELAGTFLVLIFSSVVFSLTFSDPIDLWFAVAYFSALFYILVGIKDLILINREGWKIVLSFALAYPAFLMFFYHSQSHFWLKLPLLFAVLLFLSKDFLKKRIVFWIAAFLSFQVAWASDFLPIGFVSSANLSMLFYALTISYCDQYLRGLLSRRYITTSFSVFVVLLVAIFVFSSWGF